MLNHLANHSLSPDAVIPHHLSNHGGSPAPHNHQLYLNRVERPYSPQGSPESQTSSVYLSPPMYPQTEDDYAQQVHPQTMSGVRQTSPRFEAESSKKTYINLSTPPVEGKGVHGGEKSPYAYSPATTPTHLQEKYNGFVASSNHAWRAQEAITVRESQARPSTVIACEAAQRPTISHASSTARVGQLSDISAFDHLRELLYDDLNRDEFDVYLVKKEI